MSKKQKLYIPIKRIIGIFLSILGIILCSLLLWWWVLLINFFVTKGHPIFVQKRYGRNKKVFKMLKFRTMKLNVDPFIGATNMNDKTYSKVNTKFGSFLRASSIDETLQFFNVLLGSMALVGPRPDMIKNDEYLIQCRDKCSPNPYLVRPGLTGYAQVKLKRSHDQILKAKYDSEYVKRISLFLDIKIFLYTAFKIFGIIKGK